mmetsp:Transcript_25587/g.40093  ORF Transcript_25587/g.40093 Transcript_25587/m.40093 type:complete len:327 (-) Transcript_25587:2259-3239(-)
MQRILRLSCSIPASAQRRAGHCARSFSTAEDGDVRPRRSVLFMPGSNAKAIQKAKTLAADVVILDLEDAVAPAVKVDAREAVVKAVQQGGFGKREVAVRANGLDTEWAEGDIKALAQSGADAVLMPKVESAEEVLRIHELFDQHGAPPSMKLWCNIETPRGVLRADQIGEAGRKSGRLGAFVMGTSDLTKELRGRHTRDREPVLTSLSLVLLAARAHGLIALDGVHLDLEDPDGFRRVCEQGQEMGFDGKTLIHPKQIAIANKVFSPSQDDIDLSGEIVEAYHKALEENSNVVVVRGKLIENLHVDNAVRILEMANAIEELEKDLV